ncbi:hypothetical protein KDX00_03825 [Cobetia amphilecti]|nr:hypothetical protein KDX00_03825 [Cobetia litoralis]
MKRPTKEGKAIKLRIDQNRSRTEKKRKNIKGPRIPVPATKGYYGSKIDAPEAISIYSPESQAFKDTIIFIDNVRNTFGPSKKVIDFSSTRSMTAAAMAMLYCELELARGDNKFKGIIVWSDSHQINKIIKKTGISKIIFGSETSFDISTIEELPIISSHDTELMDEVCDHVIKKCYDEDLAPQELASREATLSSAVAETVDNVCFHAYDRDEKIPKRWWLCCHIIDEMLYLAIYDYGVGIPTTARNHAWFLDILKEERPELFKEAELTIGGSKKTLLDKISGKINDSDAIYISMIDDFSETEKRKHGQGSKSIKDLVNKSENGKLWIFSGKGMYKFEREEDHPQLCTLSSKIPGTLIQWNIKLS